MKIKNTRLLPSLAILFYLLVAAFFPINALATADTDVQGYSGETPLDAGIIVQLSGKDKQRKVKAASKQDVQKMFGVIVDKSLLSVTLSTGLSNEVYVATAGTYQTIVSTQGGAIEAGDYLTMSAINGVAMKAGLDKVTVFGRAIASFDGKGVTRGATTLKDSQGNTTEDVVLGSVPVTIDIKQNPNVKSTKTNLPNFLERAGVAVADKEVSAIRMYICIAITAVSLIIALIVVYAGVRNSMISIGRNPMSKKTIFRALMEVIITSVLILIVGLFAVYLLLKL